MKIATRMLAATVLALAGLPAYALSGSRADQLLGASVPIGEASRSIALSSKTPYVNVRYGEVVRFDANGQSFAVKFDGVRGTFHLNALAPEGALDHVVRVYVEATDHQPL